MPTFNLKQLFTWDSSLACVLAHFIWRSIFPFDSARIQRFYMASSIFQAQKVFHYTAISRLFVLGLFSSLAIALHVGGHVIPDNQNVLYYIVQLAYFPGMRGMLVTTLIALLMSTADSCLHVASVFFANDLWPIMRRSGSNIGQPSLKVARIASIGIGILSLIMVLHTTSMIQLLTKIFSLYGTVISVPFIMTCLGFRPRPITVLLSMGSNAIISICRLYYSAPTMANLSPLEGVIWSGKRIFISLIFSALILLAIHYLLPKAPHTGWVGSKDRSLWDLQNQATKRWWMKRLQQLKQACTTDYRRNLVPQKVGTFILLGSYSILNTSLALGAIQKNYCFPYIYGYMAIIAIATIVMLYPALKGYPKRKSTILHGIWHSLFFLLLFLAPLQWAKLAHYKPFVSALVVCNIAIASTLASLETTISMMACAIAIHKYLPSEAPCLK